MVRLVLVYLALLLAGHGCAAADDTTTVEGERHFENTTDAPSDSTSASSLSSPLFHIFFDADCLSTSADPSGSGSGAELSLPDPLGSASHFWEAFAGQLRVEALAGAMLSIAAFASVMLAGGVTDLKAAKAQGSCLAKPFVFFQVLLAVSQIVCMVLSMLMAVLSYHVISVRLSPCLRPWGGITPAPFLHVAVLPVFLWQPFFFQRFAILAISLESLSLAAEYGLPPCLYRLASGCSACFCVVWRAGLLLQLVAFVATLAMLFSFAFVPASLCLLFLYLLASLVAAVCRKKFPGRCGSALLWSISGRVDAKSALDQSLFSLRPAMPALVQTALAGTVLAPLVCLGYFCAWDVYQAAPGQHQAARVADAYVFFFGALADARFVFPPWFDLHELDLGSVLETLADMSAYVDMDPGPLLQASSTLATLQMLLSAAKGLISLANWVLKAMEYGGAVPTRPFAGAAMKATVVQDPVSVLKNAQEELRGDREVVLTAVREDIEALQYASEALWGDREFVLAVIQLPDRARYALERATQELRGDKEVLLAALQEDGLALEYASEELRGDKEVVLAAVRQNGLALEFASKELRGDKEFKEFVLAAVRQKGDALKHASEELRGDKEVVLAAVQQNGFALRYASEELRGDKEVVLAAVRQNGSALQYASEALWGDREFVRAVIQLPEWAHYALEHATQALWGDREFVLAVIQLKLARYALERATQELRGDKEVVLAAVQQNGWALQHASEELRGDKEFVLAAVQQNGRALRYASEALQRDGEVTAAARGDQVIAAASDLHATAVGRPVLDLD